MHLFISQRTFFVYELPSDLIVKSKEHGLKTLYHMPMGLEQVIVLPLIKEIVKCFPLCLSEVASSKPGAGWCSAHPAFPNSLPSSCSVTSP